MLKYAFLHLFTIMNFITSASDLDRIIPPEIKNDAFYHLIYRLAKTEPLSTILEIGSSSGEGSTEAFVHAISENPHHPTLFCMELSIPRYNALMHRYGQVPYVKCYNVSSVPLDAFPKESEVVAFFNNTSTNLNQYGCNNVISWLRQDIEYVKTAGVPQHGIEIIKTENNIEFFDMVLIDGSEFTGSAEFKLIYGAQFILLDDINAFKNYHNYHSLRNDPSYALIEENLSLRNGYAVFKKLKR